MEKGGTSNYLKKIGKRKLLTKEQEIELSKLIEDGTKTETHTPSNQQSIASRHAKKRMIEANLRLVVSIAKGYQNRGCELDDLISAGNVGLMKAVERFDWRRGFRFSTYGSWWIRQAVTREIDSQGRSIRVPGRTAMLSKLINDARIEFIELHGQEPKLSELAETLNITETTVLAMLDGPPMTISLDDVTSNDQENKRKIRDTVPDDGAVSPLDTINKQELVSLVNQVLESLSHREELILRLRFGIGADCSDHINFPVTQEEIDTMQEVLNEK